MKIYVLVPALFVACASASLMSMENGQERLNFLLSHSWRIKASSSQNMQYEVPRTEFLGKKITEAVPLSEYDAAAISKALTDAAQNQRTVKVPYSLNKKAFLATITPIIKANQKNNFFVKVQDNEDCVKIDD